MKNTTLLCTAAVMLAGSLSLSANNELNDKKKTEPQTTFIKKKSAFVNMAGPSSISRTGTGYIYEVKMIPYATNIRWQIMGNPIREIPAIEPIINGKTAITLNGDDFVGTNPFTLSLIGDDEDGTPIVLAAKGITVY